VPAVNDPWLMVKNPVSTTISLSSANTIDP